ncbi:hypothetical protein KAR91_24765 [Candidatus Pacearchaeota archaeon]|nr:hypothetical protein [Candidatus Pacearchaeota archaeon]
MKIPRPLTAKTEIMLVKRMREISINFSGSVRFFDFTYANKKWVCWYELTDAELLSLSK